MKKTIFAFMFSTTAAFGQEVVITDQDAPHVEPQSEIYEVTFSKDGTIEEEKEDKAAQIMATQTRNAIRMREGFVAICEAAAFGKVTLSDKAKEDCDTQQHPKLLNDNSRFANRGTGAEFNALIRNVETILN